MAEPLDSVGKRRDSTTNKHPSGASRDEVSRKLSSDGRSDDEIDKHHREARKDEGPSGSRSDSKAEPDQRGASDSEDLSEKLEELNIGEGAARGNETPPQIKQGSVAEPGNAKKKLDYDDQSHNDGNWLENHKWEREKPTLVEETFTKVKQSVVYPLPDRWLKSNKTDVDLKKIYSDLPTFINEMKGPSIRKELEDILNSTLLKVIGSTNTKLSPHVLEIKEKDVPPKDKPSLPQGNNNIFKAFTSLSQQHPSELEGTELEGNYWFLDCEYMLKMYLPDYPLELFNCGDTQGKRIREINPEKKDERWIFIPSFRRSQIALLEWPEDDTVTRESTIRILVVRPSEFREYVTCCGHMFPVICLPQDEIGAGYSRYWIQKIALRLKLQFIWMIDDSVECFYEYYVPKKPPTRKDEKGERVCNYKDNRRRKFGLVFKRIEDFVKEADDKAKPIAAMSPRRWNPKCKPEDPFSCMPPQCAVYLNLRALLEKNVYYRPELKTFEDMIFGYECEQERLRVYRDNSIMLQDHNWKDTGARSLSVKSKTKKSNEEQ